MNNPTITIEMENGGVIKAELYPEIAPNTVNNFVSLVKKGFYDGVVFHRVIPGFMIQGGDPQGTGVGGPGYSIKGEFAGNGFQKRTEAQPRRAVHGAHHGAQFRRQPVLHHARGRAPSRRAVRGLRQGDRGHGCGRRHRQRTGGPSDNDKPKTAQVMKKVTVETFGVDYPEPQKV
jgi:peptidyl-prolyl cis-trans isomerase B (cyclophilin B)